MGFIKKDVNLGLLIIVLLLAVAMTILGIYYNQNYSMLSSDYNSKLDALKKVTDDLLYHKSRLNQTTTDLMVMEQDESELSKKYSALRTSNEDLEKKNSQLQKDYNQLTLDFRQKDEELRDTKSKLVVNLNTIEEQKRKIDLLENSLDVWQDRANGACNGNLGYCD